MTKEKEPLDPKSPWTMEDYKRAIKEAADAWYVSNYSPKDTETNDDQTS